MTQTLRTCAMRVKVDLLTGINRSINNFFTTVND
jgi:hypothetical protein